MSFIFALLKGQIISKQIVNPKDSFKKRTKALRIPIKTNSFVRVLEECMAKQCLFKINWPFAIVSVQPRMITIFNTVHVLFITECCTFSKTGQVGIQQKLYCCITCKMVDGHCICEICINNCHEGHNVVFSEDDLEGYCDCGEQGSQGKRPCNMLKGRFYYFS